MTTYNREDILRIISSRGLTAYEIAKHVPVTEASILNLISGRTAPRKTTLKIIGDFLYETKEFKKKETNGNTFTKIDEGIYILRAPLIPINENLKWLNDGRLAPNQFKNVGFKVEHPLDGNFVIFVTDSSSMNGGEINDTPNNALLLSKEQNNWDNLEHSKYGFVILSKIGNYHKDIIGINNGKLLLKPRSKSPEYSQFELELNQVIKIFLVVKRQF